MDPICHLISYASPNFADQQFRWINTTHYVRNPKVMHIFGPSDIDENFRSRNSEILDQPRGNGFWLWKPYFIDRVIQSATLGDIIFYCDSGSKFVSSPSPLFEIVCKEPNGMIAFEQNSLEKCHTKRYAFVKLGLDLPEYYDTFQRMATFVLFRVTEESRAFVKEWLRFCQDPILITDAPSPAPLQEMPEFRYNVGDQSVFSLLTKKHCVSTCPDPTQYGNNDPNRDALYSVIMLSTRTVRPGCLRWIRMHCLPYIGTIKRWLRMHGISLSKFLP